MTSTPYGGNDWYLKMMEQFQSSGKSLMDVKSSHAADAMKYAQYTYGAKAESKIAGMSADSIIIDECVPAEESLCAECKDCRDCKDSKGTSLCPAGNRGHRSSDEDEHCNYCTCDTAKAVDSNMPKFSQYTDEQPLGPNNYFYNSTKKLVKISSMRPSYKRSSATWVKNTFDFNKYPWAEKKFYELMKG